MKILQMKDLRGYIPVRMASTGSNCEAEMAGKIPETNPINAAKEVPRMIFPRLSTKSKSATCDKMNAVTQTKKIPMMPPKTDKITASNKNWNKMNLFLAPSDFEFRSNSCAP